MDTDKGTTQNQQKCFTNFFTLKELETVRRSSIQKMKMSASVTGLCCTVVSHKP